MTPSLTNERRVLRVLTNQRRLSPGQPLHVGGDDVRVMPGDVIVTKVICYYHYYVGRLLITACKTVAGKGSNKQQQCRKIHYILVLFQIYGRT